jgi:hypothetical protein
MVTKMEAEQRVLTGFWIHLAAYVGVVTGLAILNMTRNPDKLWVLWVAGGWGIGIALHALGLFVIPGGRERMIERTADRMERREARHEHRQTPA